MRDAHYRHPAAAVGRPATGALGHRGILALVLALAAFTLAPAPPVVAATLLSGEVLQVADAVSFVMRAEGGRRVKVRLAGVAAPDGRAAGLARRALARLVFGRDVTVRAADIGETPLRAQVSVGGTDVAATLVANGWLAADGSRPGLEPLERSARRLRLGLWKSAP